MSVRNILDGTIKIGGGEGGWQEVQTEQLTVGTTGMLCTGPITCANTATIDKLKAITSVETPSLTATGKITARTYTGDNVEVGTVSATGWVKTEVLRAVSKITSTGPIEALSGVSTTSLTATSSVTTPALTLGETPVLTPTMINENQTIAVTYSDGSTGTLTAQVHSKVCNINAEQHLLTCQFELKSLSKALKQVIIPTGLDFTGRQTDSHNTTAALINKTDLLLGLVHIYVESSQLMAKVVFSETPSYTSMLIRINIVFN